MHRGITTTLLHADRNGVVEHGAVHKPMHAAVAYGYRASRDLAAVFQGRQPGHVYGRQGNPTTAALEAKVSMLEDAVGTVCFATGMAAIGSMMLALLRRGDHVVASRYLFGNTASLIGTLAGIGIEVTLADATDVAAVEAAVRPNTRLVFVETIANPVTQVADLEGIGALCTARGIVYVVDNTMTTPALFRPRSVGASLVVNSLTKSICGHGNALGGAVSDTSLFDWSAYPNIAAPYRKGDPAGWGLQQIRKKGLRDLGATLGAEHAHRIAVGAETLVLRMERACANALQLAQWLQAQPGVARVHYPGLDRHPQHERAMRLFRRQGALLSFELDAAIDCFDFLDALDLVVKSSHLGDTRTLAIPVAHTIFFEMGPEQRRQMGIAESLIRLSVGIEDYDDLQADFAQALERTRGAASVPSAPVPVAQAGTR
ncbi:MAG TPA: cystathionine gamma-synthase family protein [Quisquiliibacterium sp.]|nr:cystathionine gamma-synthase family protein [Quisquiliibacterium sp.]